MSLQWMRGFRGIVLAAAFVLVPVPTGPDPVACAAGVEGVYAEDIHLERHREGDYGEVAELRVNGEIVARIRAPHGGLRPAARGEIVIRRLREALHDDGVLQSLRPEQLDDGSVVVAAGEQVMVTVDRATAEHNDTSPFGLARAWSENLREALDLPPLTAEAAGWHEPADAEDPVEVQVMVASWYSDRFAGRRTANGEIYDPDRLTAAHRTLPFGTVLRVTYPVTGESVQVRINDRGPFVQGRHLDLSRAAATRIGMARAGVAEVEVSVLAD